MCIYKTNYSIKMDEKQMNERELMAEEDKQTFYFKKNVSLQEYMMYLYVCNLNTNHVINIPKIYSYDEKNKILQTQRIPNESIAFNYGEKPSKCPKHLLDEIRKTITTLYNNGIEYPDITGYNFIEYKDKIWIIDFEHAKHIDAPDKKTDPFVKKFINGSKKWNPLFTQSKK